MLRRSHLRVQVTRDLSHAVRAVRQSQRSGLQRDLVRLDVDEADVLQHAASDGGGAAGVREIKEDEGHEGDKRGR